MSIQVLFLTSFLGLWAQAQAPAPYIVQIDGTYIDDAGATVATVGTGTVFRYEKEPGKPRFFVLTADHVSQGASTADEELDRVQVRVGGRVVRPVRRWGNGQNDVKLLELPPGNYPDSILYNNVDKNLIFNDRGMTDFYRARIRGQGTAYPGFVELSGGKAPVLVPNVPWAQGPGRSSVGQNSPDQLTSVNSWVNGSGQTLLAGGQVRFEGNVTPGQSGAPLIELRFSPLSGNALPTVVGVASSVERDFSGTYFSSREQIASLIDQVELSPAGSRDDVQFRMSDGFTYRKFANGSVDMATRQNSNLLRPQVSGIRADPSGIRADPSGIRADPSGGGTAGDVEDCNRISPSFWSKTDVRPGQRSASGQNIIGYKVFGFGVFADTDYEQFLSRLNDYNRALGLPASVTGTEIPIDTDYINLYQSRVRDAKECPQVMEKHRRLEAALARQGNPRFKTERTSGGNLRVSLDLPNNQERIEFDIARNGSVVGSNTQFEPIIQVKGDKGTIYVVDLRELFFVDLTTLSIPGQPSRDRQTQVLVSSFVQHATRMPRIKVQRKCAHDQSQVVSQDSSNESLKKACEAHANDPIQRIRTLNCDVISAQF